MRISDWSSDVCSSDLSGGSGAVVRSGAGSRHRRFPGEPPRLGDADPGARMMLPAPPATPETAKFAAAAREGRFLIRRCTASAKKQAEGRVGKKGVSTV